MPAEPQSKADVVRAYVAATTRGRAEDLRPLLAADAVVHYPGQHFLSGDYRTNDAIVDLHKTISALAEKGGFEPVLHEVVEGQDFVVAIMSYRLGLLLNRDLPGRSCGLFRVADGKIKEYWLFEWDQSMLNDAFRVAGLRIARQRKGMLSMIAQMPRSGASVVRLVRRLYGGYTAPTGV